LEWKYEQKKLEIIAFLDKTHPVRCEKCVNNKCSQVKSFKYLGCKISYENGKDVPQKPAKYANILGI